MLGFKPRVTDFRGFSRKSNKYQGLDKTPEIRQIAF
jgi:hypothetical protein